MNRFFRVSYKPRDIIVILLLAVSVFLLAGSVNVTSAPGDVDGASRKLERQISKRLNTLDSFMDYAIGAEDSRILRLNTLPDDMVIYRYVGDTLVSWCNQFSVTNDDISTRYIFQTISSPKAEVNSPLNEVGEEVSFINMGPRWYLARCVVQDNVRVIGGLKILDEMDRSSYNGVNRHFRLSDKFSVKPLTFSGGASVSYEGIPQFKVLYDSMQRYAATNSYLVWLSLLFFLVAVLLFLYNDKTLGRYLAVMAALIVAMAAVYFWGLRLRNDARLFSPALYADGAFLYSLGAVVLVNLFIILFVTASYMVRNVAMRDVLSRSRDSRFSFGCIAAGAALVIVLILAYTFAVLRSITLNSGICLELYKINETDVYTLVVYVSFMLLLLTIPLLLQMMRPGLKMAFGVHFDAFSPRSRALIAVIAATCMVTCTSLFGLRKEQDRQSVWANRLSIERELALEMQFRSAESSIAGDRIIGALAGIRNGANAVLNRIADNYLQRITQDYDISVYIVREDEANAKNMAFLMSRIQDAEPISPDSHFLYRTSHTGRTSYTGHFVYFNKVTGLSHVLVEVEAKSNRIDKGYSTLLGLSAPGRVLLPTRYSYARYDGRDLSISRGKFSYPNRIDDHVWELISDGVARFSEDGFVHFINQVSDNSFIVISRPKLEVMAYIVTSLLIAMVVYMFLSVLNLTKRRKKMGQDRRYYKTRVTFVLVISLVLTLVAMATVSVYFVYRRNDANNKAMMTDKVNSIRAIIESNCEQATSYRDLNTPEFNALVDEASNMVTSDISLYTPGGKVLYSTTPEIFNRAILGSRIDHSAYEKIIYQNRRYYIQRERIGDKRFFSLYAPVYNSSGKLLAILKTPYTDENLDFETDAIFHTATMFVVFIILLAIARLLIMRIIGRLFKPLEEMSQKMNAGDVDSLRLISYDNDDEIKSLVTSYNKMVGDLTESTRQLAQAERDKAWSGMARQVAHEIKNPLTPMKLQLQRIVRLKSKGAPGWEDKFDEVISVVLDHIDVLTATANEFSTFAKLYSEEPVDIDLDQLLEEEITMFDSRENLDFQYYGLDGACISGPKPQLTRVFVNLLTNSVQAITNRQAEEAEAGREVQKGVVAVSLRNSSEDGYYDIVFEDNGPGVDEENLSKLFTPHFTTKSSGTGLGLAMCRSILEKCDATISYSRSFSLGGACFSIHYPKK